ncbi:MAG: GNAT family N-acetyltransferase [Rhodobacteraceae bacterium]|nr:GNAT family N-acetyltransferase [Paracoccaceae bacterium]
MFHRAISIPPTGACHDQPGWPGALAWQLLAPHADLPTQSPEFQAALADTLLRGRQYRVLACEGAGGPDACIALSKGTGRLAAWRMAGDDEVFEPGDALCRDGAAVERLAQQLARLDEPLEFARLPAGSALIPPLRAAMRGRGLLSIRPATPSPWLALDASWGDPDSHFSARRRSDFRRYRRRAEELGGVSLAMHSPDAAAFDALFDEAIAVELRSWKREAGSAIACNPDKEAFFRQYLRAASAAGQCRIAFMRIDGRPVAMQLAVVSGGHYWLYKIGYDEDFSRCSPGNLLMLHAVGEAVRAGLSAFEFMGEAEGWIAELWTRSQHPCVRLRTYPFSLVGMAALARDSGQWLRARARRSMV